MSLSVNVGSQKMMSQSSHNSIPVGKFLSTSSATRHTGTVPLTSKLSLKPVNDLHLVGTRIICTIGPKIATKDGLVSLLQAGMNIARLNFSHGDHEYHKGVIQNLNAALSETRKLCAVMLDTKGPEIRTGKLANPDEDISLVKGETLSIYLDDRKTTNKELSVSYKKLPTTVTPGHRILFDDGLISTKVLKVHSDHIDVMIENSGKLGGTKGVNIPEGHLQMPVLTEKDTQDILFGIDCGIDFIALSFTRNPKDIMEARNLLDKHPKARDIKIIAKIENQEGVNNFDAILDSCDGIMVARGDLGVEIPIEKVALYQKSFITKCNIAGKLSICATQMLDSMISNPRPTRAEATDVSNAVFDGADCVMLSGETAKGLYPTQAVSIMQKICRETEHMIDHTSLFNFIRSNVPHSVPVVEAIAIAGVRAASSLKAALIIAPTNTGRTAVLLAKYRPSIPILVLTSNEQTARQCLAYRGLFPMVVGTLLGSSALISRAITKAKQIGLCKTGDLVVATSGGKDGVSGLTSMLKVVSVT